MKRKYAAMILGLVLTVSSVNVYAESPDAASEAATESFTDNAALAGDNVSEENTVYGEITEITPDSVTVSTGKWHGPNATGILEADATETSDAAVAVEGTADGTTDTADANAADGTADAADPNAADGTADAADPNAVVTDESPDGDGAVPFSPDEWSSFLQFDGEEKTLPITADTEISRYTDTVELEAPNTDTTDETADENAAADETTDAADENAATDETADAADENAATSDTTDAAGENAAADKTETIALSDIQVGDIVKITFDENGNATAITVVMYTAPDSENELSENEDAELPESDASGSEASTELVIE